jgi:hypothetical protein
MASPLLAQTIQIHEIRLDQTGANNEEYFELYGDAGASLDDLTYLVIGDSASGGSGVIEEVVSLDGLVIGPEGYFLCTQGTSNFYLEADLVHSLNFENQKNVTHLLVRNFFSDQYGVGSDLDQIGAGCALETFPWSQLIDSVAIIRNPGPPDDNCVYSTTTVGPMPDPYNPNNPDRHPSHVYRDADGNWRFDLVWDINEQNAYDTPRHDNGKLTFNGLPAPGSFVNFAVRADGDAGGRATVLLAFTPGNSPLPGGGGRRLPHLIDPVTFLGLAFGSLLQCNIATIPVGDVGNTPALKMPNYNPNQIGRNVLSSAIVLKNFNFATITELEVFVLL